MDLKELRAQIDEIDDELVKLFCKRMDIAAQVADYKKENGLPIFVPAREREKLQDVSQKAGPEMAAYTRTLYSMLFELSRSYQKKRNGGAPELYEKISQAIRETPALFPQEAMVACQGVEGAYSQLACEKVFKSPMIRYFRTFDEVFQAIDDGLCKYGVLPIENSTAGSVTKVYDLMLQHDFYIVRSFRLKIDHNLLAAPGAKMEDIRVIYSHEQAINQCSGFLRNLKNVNVVRWPIRRWHQKWWHPPGGGMWRPSAAVPAWSCMVWKAWLLLSRIKETTAHGSSASARIWRFFRGRTRPAL